MQKDRNRSQKLHGIRLDHAVHCQNMHACFSRRPEGRTKSRIRSIIGFKTNYMVHLNDKQDIGPKPRLNRLRQAAQMFGSPQSRSVGKANHAAVLQGDPLHFQQAPAAILQKGKIKAPISMLPLPPQPLYRPQPTSPPPL